MAFATAVGFAFLVRSNRSISTSSLYRVQSQMLADSALNQAISVLRSAYNPTDGANDDHDSYPATVPGKNFYSPSTGPFVGRSYWCSTSSDHSGAGSNFATKMGRYNFVPNAILDVSHPEDPVEEDRGFIPVLTDGLLIGRISFMIIDESGKLDPNAVTLTDVSEASGTSARVGSVLNEISLEDTGIENFDSYVLSNDERWFSTRQIARQLDAADFENRVIQVLHPFSRDQEQYWNDDDNNDIIDAAEIYDRLDITSSSGVSLESLYKAFVSANDVNSEFPNIGDVDDDNDCSWLKDLTSDGILTNGMERRLVAAQVALNIKDYVDEDDEATIAWVTHSGELTRSDPGEANTELTVYGRENQYGISELSAMIMTGVSGSGSIYDLDMCVFFMGEIFIPNSEGHSLGSHQLTVTYSLTVESSLGATQTFFNNASLQVSLDTTANEDGGTLWFSSDWHYAGSHLEANFLQDGVDSQYQITNFQIDSCILNDGTNDIDSFPSQSNHDYWWNWQSSSTLAGMSTLYASLEAYDPLNNSQDEDGPMIGFHALWRASPAASSLVTNADSVGIGQLTLLDDGSGSSLSEYGDIQVKNASFERIGELGRVGSYWPGRSIRLWAAEADDEVGTDTYLLDLFKVGSLREVKGHVNINTTNSNVLTALLANTTTISTADAVATILDKRNTVTFNNIGDIFQISGISGSDKTQDNSEEDMVTKLAELITVRQNYFTIVVTAQSIKDTGNQTFYKDLNNDGDSYDFGETIETKFGEYDHEGDQILGTTKLLAVVYRDAFTNEFIVEHIEYLK